MLPGGEGGDPELIVQGCFEFLEDLINLAVRAGAVYYPGGDVGLCLVLPL